jgi:glycosyltransferase involved in cell wall biosynthesis
MKRLFNLFLFLLPLLSFGLEKREKTCSLKTSVIIPCAHSHFPLLEGLLSAYEKQTRLPDEVVVSLSEADSVGPISIAALEQKSLGFALKIIPHEKKLVPGASRNAACHASTGDLIICQDADDLPHPQRVEIIASLFENYFLDHLIHQWIPSSKAFEAISPSCVDDLVYAFQHYAKIDIPDIHNGSVSFLRDVFAKVHWKPIEFISEDVIFNQHAYAFCKNKAILKLPLIQYRFELSTFDLESYK